VALVKQVSLVTSQSVSAASRALLAEQNSKNGFHNNPDNPNKTQPESSQANDPSTTIVLA
jgi:hypothetical protein